MRDRPDPFRLRRRAPQTAHAGVAPVLGLIVLALVAPAAIGPGPAPAPSPTEFAVRPYAAESPWNTAIAEGAEIDPRSRELVATIAAGPSDDVITSDPTQFAFPVYMAHADTPRSDVACTQYKCTIAGSPSPRRVGLLQGVPIPKGARPSAGSDSSMIVVDPATGTEYDLWQAKQDEDGSWTVSNGSVYNVGWDGAPVGYGSRGAGVPYLAGLVRHWEIAQDKLEHAIAFAYPNASAAGCVWPASKTDGKSKLPNALPEGARLQLDPSLTDADLQAMGLDRTGRIIARAMQRYGMILIDVSGRAKIVAEDLTANKLASVSWSDPGTVLTAKTISAIPIDAFRVMKLPDGWSDGSAAQRHGRCAQ
jgi:hypothetical protein